MSDVDARLAEDANRIRVACYRLLAQDSWERPYAEAGQAALDRLLAVLKEQAGQIERLQDERKLGPQTQRCPNASCSMRTCGSGYATCPKCGGTLEATADAVARSGGEPVPRRRIGERDPGRYEIGILFGPTNQSNAKHLMESVADHVRGRLGAVVSLTTWEESVSARATAERSLPDSDPSASEASRLLTERDAERERIAAFDRNGCTNGPDEYGHYPCDPAPIFGTDEAECQACGRVAKWGQK